jgi:3'(2'), 5'-bisphosphate nucleotidase
MTPDSLLQAALEIAQAAGGKILAVYNTDFAVERKDDNSPLTRADLASHGHIVNALSGLQPRLPVLSEESAATAFNERSQWERYWLVDPLDGTKEFIKRNGEFTVNIALIERHRPVLGVVHAPALGLSYAAAEGAGAFRQDGVRRTRLRTRECPPRPVYVVSRSHRDPALEKLLAAAPPHETVSRGSALKFCLVAEGSADFYPRTGPTSEWDTAAGQCVVEQAGGAVWRLPALTPLAYNEKESLLNPSFAVVGDAKHDWKSLLSS